MEKKNINNEKKINRTCSFVKEKKDYYVVCIICLIAHRVYLGKKGPVLIQNG